MITWVLNKLIGTQNERTLRRMRPLALAALFALAYVLARFTPQPELVPALFAAGVFQGRGRYEWTNGDRYEGQWKDGRKDGQGEMRWKDGRRWVGVFKDDEQEDGEMFEAGR